MNACAKRLNNRRDKATSKDEWGFSESEIPKFLNELYALSAQPRQALRRAFTFMDQALLEGKFKTCDTVLEIADFKRLDLTTATGLLAITLQAKQQLKNRESYYSRIDAWLQQVNPEEAIALLAGLE